MNDAALKSPPHLTKRAYNNHENSEGMGRTGSIGLTSMVNLPS